MRDTWRAGATFFKIFTCTTHGVPGLQGADLRRALATIASFDGICLIHCEDEEMTRDAEVALRAAGRVDPGVLPMWRSREAELTAVRAAVELILETGARATIAHVSSPAVAEIVVEGRRRGASLGAEACPQYFHLREDEVLEYGPLRKFTPPARNTSPEDESEMWGLLGSGALSHVATDHAPATREQKLAGDMWEAPFGLPGLDTTSRLLFDAVAAGRLTWLDVGLRYAWEPARLYGLEPSKGTLSVGADADIVLVDPDADVTIRDEDVLSKAGWTPFAGRRTRGDTVMVFLRGNEIARGGAPTGDLGGRFLHGPGADTD
jgi:dihydroorotase-like cyclic amidohydrolase